MCFWRARRNRYPVACAHMRRRFRIKDDWSFEELIEASRDLAEGEHIFSGAQYNAHRIRIEEKIRTFLTDRKSVV